MTGWTFHTKIAIEQPKMGDKNGWVYKIEYTNSIDITDITNITDYLPTILFSRKRYKR